LNSSLAVADTFNSVSLSNISASLPSRKPPSAFPPPAFVIDVKGTLAKSVSLIIHF